MSTLDDAVGKALSTLTTCGVDDPDVGLLRKIVSQMGPSAYGGDGENVSCSDPEELDRIRGGFVKTKLGVDDAATDSVEAVCEQMKPAGSHKRRSAFYYLLTTRHGKASVYDD